ncbi:MAG: VWA domain-containing protein [Desulfosarcinaceae bacterium]|nr:VWA domain-containing protein [Desulfosarcinaceae bacterium]
MRQQHAIIFGVLFSIFGMADCFPALAARISVSDSLGPLSVEAALVQGKVLLGGPGDVSMALTLRAQETPPRHFLPVRPPIDLVVVLDRSGSMSGAKFAAARQAIAELIQRLRPQDRFALVSYANGVSRHTDLKPMNRYHRQAATEILFGITTGGGTNLGGGLQSGIALLRQHRPSGRQGRALLISDGLANQGVTDPHQLGEMAAAASEDRLAVTTIGVGLEFNEQLLSLLADRGAGRYYFLEHANDFAAIFTREWEHIQATAVSGIRVRIELPDGIRLIAASGYPVTRHPGAAEFTPGDLLDGQERTLYLSFRVPTDAVGPIRFGDIQIRFQDDRQPYELTFRHHLEIACSASPDAVRAAVDKDRWAEKVVREDVNHLKESVAADIKSGRREAALKKIRAFKAAGEAANASVGSARVSEALDETAQTLEAEVTEAFAGPPAASLEKRKQRSKALQYEGYQQRRAVP